MYIINVFVLCLVIGFSVTVKGLSLPHHIKACKAREPTLKECALKSGNDAIPSIVKGNQEYGIPNLNPLVLPLVTASGFGDLGLNFTNLIITGLADTKLVDFGIDFSKQNLFLDMAMIKLTLDSDYSITGKIVSLPIEGNGRAKVEIYGARINYNFDFNEKEKDGKHYIEIRKDDVGVNPEKVTFKFENLFNGNEQLGNHVNNFLNENWRDVLVELQPAISGVVGSLIKSIAGRFISRIPLEELFLDY